ncbi:endonuclease III-like protein 1 isoform X1 [Pollicipes pollicipes]|uniref:endonuclease III-like protein 1 isoform X1 n=2 Tax=Pollicipes pollicipes TaxID=41117 RepID=UPI001884BE26|nr:endonuclease III-like protein 1 isoform X1 [Pollicipes pollicipes]
MSGVLQISSVIASSTKQHHLFPLWHLCGRSLQMEMVKKRRAPDVADESGGPKKECQEPTQSSKPDAPLASKLRKKINAEPGPPPAEPCVPDIEDWCPAGWQQVLENVRSMRAARDAAVDRMGAESFAADPQVVTPELARLHVLVSLMLSSQTRDEINHAAMTRLKAAGLSVPWLLQVDQGQLAQLIKPVGFWRRKAEYLKKTVRILQDEYAGDIPPSVESLCKLPGVGPKMAHLCMNIAWKQVSGIGVDTHVHRISNRLGWVRRPTATPERTRLALQAWLPRQHWSEINLLLVGFGQQICTPVAPRCGDCLNFSLCPSARLSPKKPKR